MLTTLHRFNAALGIRTRCYWSSKGSRDEYSSEWLLLSLVHPLCLVKSVSVRPFRATFQRVQPWFSPALICSAGSGSLTHAAVCTLLHLHASPAGTGIGISHESFILLPAGRACSLAVHECCILQGIVTSGTSSRHIANAWCCSSAWQGVKSSNLEGLGKNISYLSPRAAQCRVTQSTPPRPCGSPSRAACGPSGSLGRR